MYELYDQSSHNITWIKIATRNTSKTSIMADNPDKADKANVSKSGCASKVMLKCIVLLAIEVSKA